ncbi:hypothetical protein [Tardiphaga sp. vice278]|uniref:hypothetical protein n=1 Tax=Tardiphaga sp. vice278 TaxID=2592815 RepID=UPI0011635016|nr:hypothetical protein [Tardiphaga sp. vice278]QDM18174.1 hypothetical protein FNL53_21235 [Tardiphaga sp. vice278]
MMLSDASFSARAFLQERQVVLVHFSTVMTSRPEFIFPNDLRTAINLRDIALSFSTIQCGDTNPHMTGRGGAEGSIGIIVDLDQDTIVRSVLHCDSGSNESGSLGLPPNAGNCASSIENRETSNEWRVENYLVRGIFILPPLWVWNGEREVQIDLAEVIQFFPTQRIFTANKETFLEWDRTSGVWKRVAHRAIMP